MAVASWLKSSQCCEVFNVLSRTTRQKTEVEERVFQQHSSHDVLLHVNSMIVYFRETKQIKEVRLCLEKDHNSYLGGIHIGFQPRLTNARRILDAFVVLRGTVFLENFAKVGGGGIMAAHPNHTYFMCAFTPKEKDLDSREIAARYITEMGDVEFTKLSEDRCKTWKHNSVANGGYGPLKGGYVSYAKVTFKGNESSEDKLLFERNQKNSELPLIYVVLFDEFNQSPAEPQIDHPNLIVNITAENEIDLSGQLNAMFDRGKAVFDGVILRGPPGYHNLTLIFSDKRIDPVFIPLEIAACSIDWFSVSNGKDCQKCDPGTYNFDSSNTGCSDCPDNAQCRYWGIEPKSKFWLPFPCYERPRECLTDAACNYGNQLEIII